MEGKFSYGRTDAVCDSVAGGGKTWLSMITAATEAEIKGKVGWHTFRHSYRAWLQEPGAPLAAQQELMRTFRSITDHCETLPYGTHLPRTPLATGFLISLRYGIRESKCKPIGLIGAVRACFTGPEEASPDAFLVICALPAPRGLARDGGAYNDSKNSDSLFEGSWG